MQKFMKIFLSLGLVFTILLAGCGKQAEGPKYISQDKSYCEKIAYTCPQGEEPVTDKSGCGCQKSDKKDNPKDRELRSLLQDYLALRVMSVSCEDGETYADFVDLDRFLDPQDPNEVDYIVWAVGQEYCKEGDGLRLAQSINQPMILKLSQPGPNYIVHGNVVLENEEAVRKAVQQATADRIYDADGKGEFAKKLESIETEMKVKASVLFNVPFDQIK